MKRLILLFCLLFAGCGPTIPDTNQQQAYQQPQYNQVETDFNDGEDFTLEVNKKIKFDPTQVFDLYRSSKAEKRSSKIKHTIRFGKTTIVDIHNLETGLHSVSELEMTENWKENQLSKTKYTYTTKLQYVDYPARPQLVLKILMRDGKLSNCVLGNVILSKKAKAVQKTTPK